MESDDRGTDAAADKPARRKPLTALVLSGGGARGAYEVGVLSYLFGDFVRVLGRVPPIEIVCGTSVGAINAGYLAAQMGEPVAGVRRLANMWTALELQQVLQFNARQAMTLHRVLLGSDRAVGIFDVQPLIDLVSRELSWRAVARSVRRGHLLALAISATELATGRTTVFVDNHPSILAPKSVGPRAQVVSGPVGAQHALASAAIPLVFPPVKIGSLLYCDGGLRQNTPIAPALRLGAERVLVIGLSREVRGPLQFETPVAATKAPGAPFLLGKVLNAFLLDHVEGDLELLERINGMLTDGQAAFGGEFVQKLSAQATGRGAEPYRHVNALALKPSQDIGRIAADHLRTGKVAGPLLLRRILGMLDSGDAAEADLASYLLFDGAFARRLIDLGRADAEARRAQLLEFFAEP